MLRTELLRLAFILLLTLCFFHVSAQRLNEGDYDCDEQRLFSTYQEKDQEAQITDPEMLLHLGGLSFRLNRDTLGYEYYHRILEQPRLSNDVIYFQALLELKYRDGIAISSDSVRQLIKANYSEDHDIASAHIILETLSSLNPRPTIKVDSIILTHIDHIIDKQRFSTIIVKGRQEVAIYLADQGQLHRALDVAKQSFQFVRRHFPECSPSYYNSFINIGRRYINLDQPDSARYYFQQSLDHLLSFHPENHYLKYQAAFNLASAEKKLFTYTHALLYLEQAEKFIELDTVANSADHLSKIYNERAGLYYSMGKLERSKAAYLKSIQFSATASRGPSVPKIAAYANVASQLSFLNDYDNAIKYLQLALSNSNKLLGPNHRFAGIILMKIGQVYYDQKRYHDCQKYFDQSMKIRKLNAGDAHISVANLHSNYAVLCRDQKRHDEAIHYIDSAIAIYSHNLGPLHATVANAYNRRAHINILKGNHIEAQKDITKGLKALPCKVIGQGCEELSTYLDFIEKRMHLFVNGRFPIDMEIDTFLSLAQHGDSLFNYLFSRAESVSDKSELAADYSSFYRSYIYGLIIKYEKSRDITHLYRAYQFNNKIKNLGLLSTLQDQSKYMFSSVPFDIRNKRQISIAEIKRNERAIFDFEGERDTRYQELLSQLEISNKKLKEVDGEIAENYPAFANLTNPTFSFDVEVVQETMDAKEAILDFVVLDSSLLAFVISADTFYSKVNRLNAQSIKDDALSWSEAIQSRKSNVNMPISLAVVSDAINGLGKHITKLNIIPDAFLYVLPFEILTIQDQLVFDNYLVSYANSSEILLHQKNKKSKKNKYTVSIFAPEYEHIPEESLATNNKRAEGNWELPYSQQEASFIQAVMKGRLFKDNEATKENLKGAMRNSDIVHLTMHAEANDQRPMNSRFIFETDSLTSEKNLHLFELYNLQSTVQLAVLSACETGVGEFHNGDGVRSLANGFQYAGIPSVILSLWKVPDESTSIIMKSFYSHLRLGLNKHDALRKAKLAYLDNCVSNRLKHPFYWAGLIVAGDTRPLTFSASGFPLKLVIGGICFFIFIFLVIRFIRTRK